MRNISYLALLLTMLNPYKQYISQTEGDAVFHTPMVHEIHLNFSQTGFWDSLTANYSLGNYMACDIVINGTPLPSCGVRFKGNSSYNNPSTKKSFKIDFNHFVSGQKYDGLSKINLNNGFKDPSFLREKLMLDFLNENGMIAPRCAYANVYINGQLWGLYALVEQINDKFLTQRFGNKTGNLFKGDPTGDLKWYGSTISTYQTKYELKNNETINDWNDIVNFIDKLNNSTASNLQSELDAVFNADEYIKSWASHIIFANLDSYAGSGHNYYIYHEPIQNVFRWINWDVNEAFGVFTMGLTLSQIEQMSMFYVPNPTGNRPLHSKLLANTYYKQKLVDEFCYLLNHSFRIDLMEPKIDSLVNIIRPHVYNDSKKFYTNQNFEDNINSTITVGGGPGGGTMAGIKSFIINRSAFLNQELQAWNCFLSLQDNEVKNTTIIVYPNPSNDNIYIYFGDGITKPLPFKLFSILGVQLMEGYISTNQSIDISNLAGSQTYIIKTELGNSMFIKH